MQLKYPYAGTGLGEVSKIFNEYARSLKPGEQNEVRLDDDAIVV